MFKNKEETFNYNPEKFRVSIQTKEDNVEKFHEMIKQIDTVSKYLSHLSKKVDDILVLTKLQDEKIKDLESRIGTLTARELE